MVGTIFLAYKNFVITHYDHQVMEKTFRRAHFSPDHFAVMGVYPADNLHKLLDSLSNEVGRDKKELLEDFGFFMAPKLHKMYLHLVDPTWKTREFLLHTEEVIHKVVRAKNPHANPARLRFTPIDSQKLLLDYDSKNNMVEFGIGIINGLAEYYGEKVETETITSKNGSIQIIVDITPA